MDKLKFIVANPGGNITIFVLSPVAQKDYQTVAHKLLALKEYQGEQVGFVKSLGTINKMEMCGLEFCGNAGRSFALYAAKHKGLQGKQTITIEESGTTSPLQVQVDVDTNYTKIAMPLPLQIQPWQEGTLVDLGGITHLVLEQVAPSEAVFAQLREKFYQEFQAAAFGVMFYNRKENFLIPIVYVDSVATTYWEGSCGSGSLACGLALSREETVGDFKYIFPQPRGEVTVQIQKEQGKVVANFIEGVVTFSDVYEL